MNKNAPFLRFISYFCHQNYGSEIRYTLLQFPFWSDLNKSIYSVQIRA